MREEEKRDKCQVNLSSEHRYIISINRASLPFSNISQIDITRKYPQSIVISCL